MRFHADFHIHSKYSRATSKDCDLEHLTILGTGDFTHPAWRAELRDKLVPAEPGLFRLQPGWLDRPYPVRLLLCSELWHTFLLSHGAEPG
jgi:PHP family Zn ribbon phosphoesterase